MSETSGTDDGFDSDPYGGGGAGPGDDPSTPGAGGTGDDAGPGTDDLGPLHVPDVAAATRQGEPVTVELRPQATLGAGLRAGGQLSVAIVSAPAVGTLSDPMPRDAGTLSVTYTPTQHFAGSVQFDYVLHDDTRESNVGTVFITVYPDICFAVDPTDGSRDLNVRAYAFTMSSVRLPDGVYTWRFDDREESGPVATHGECRHTFTRGGLHLVTLTVTLAGLSGPVACQNPHQGGPEAPVTVRPQVSGEVLTDSGTPMPGVALAATGLDPVTTDDQGHYELTVPHGWSGEITPSLDGYAFEPSVRVYDQPVAGDHPGDGFTGRPGQPPQQTVTISGCVLDADTNGILGVSVSADNGGGSDTTDDKGYYELTVPYEWSGSVTPSLAGYTFDPSSRPYVGLVDDLAGQDFEGTHFDLLISGYVRDADGAGLSGVLLTASDGGGSDATGADGHYEVPVPYNWSGTVTPSLADYSFDPPSRSYASLVENAVGQNFVGTHDPLTISGHVCNGDGNGVFGVSVSASNGGGSDTTDGDGFYSLDVPYHWSGTVTPSHSDYIFSPPSRDYDDATSDAANQDYEAVPVEGPTIAGTISLVETVGARPLIGMVDLAFTGSGAWLGVNFPATTDVYGVYSQEVPDGWTGTIAAADPDSCFLTPESRSYDDPVTEPQLEQDFEAWVPPIGIPAPEFGIRETHYMYAPETGATYDFGSGPEPYPDAGNGPYTHYVDNTHPNATDSGNPFGTPDMPRLRIPTTLSAGSVVELHGGPYTYGMGGRVPVIGTGTPQAPIFLRGPRAQDKPVFSGPQMRPEGSYVICEYLEFDGPSTSWSVRAAAGSTHHHLVLRRSEIHNTNGTGASTVGYLNNPDDIARHIVIFNNDIHDLGDWQSATEEDWNCVGAGMNSRYVWVLDNRLHHNQGDGVAVNWAGHGSDQVPPQYVYIGRNDIHHNQENSLDFKISYDVIVSQNVMHANRVPAGGTAFASGEIASLHNTNSTPAYPYPDRIWFLYNHLYDGDRGFKDSGSAGVYIVGNVIHDIVATGIPLMSGSGYSPGAAVQQWGHSVMHVVNNTIYDCDLGILSGGHTSATEFNLVNNIVSDLTAHYFAQFGADPYHLFVESSTRASNSDLRANLINQSGGPVRIRWNGEYTSIGALQGATGQCDGCLQEDPAFVDQWNNDLHLQGDSPAIDAGDLMDVYAVYRALYGIDIYVDCDGLSREPGEAIDMGAFEHP